MKVLKKSYEKRITCPKCNAELLYVSKDIHLVGDMEGDWDYCVTCPECGKNIKVYNIKKDMNENEQTNATRYIDKLICDVKKVLTGLGYKISIEFNCKSKLWCVELLNANSSEDMPIRHKSMIRGLVKGYLHSFEYFGGTQKIYIYDECKGLHPEDDRYSTLEYAMFRVSDCHKNDLFVNYGTYTERYIIDNNDKKAVNIAISEQKKKD